MNTAMMMLLCFFQQGAAPDTETEAEYIQKVSYVLGYQLGNGLHSESVEVSFDHILEGLTDGMQGKGKYSPDEMKKVMQKFQQDIRAKGIERRNREAVENQKVADDFLAANKAEPGVMVTDSGLQYKVMEEGSGPKPEGPTTKVKVHYRGTLIDGTEFDSSYSRNQPATFALNGVIKGWTEGVQLMPVGSKFKFFIPPELAYGRNPRPGGPIGPNMALIFDIELLEIVE